MMGLTPIRDQQHAEHLVDFLHTNTCAKLGKTVWFFFEN